MLLTGTASILSGETRREGEPAGLKLSEELNFVVPRYTASGTLHLSLWLCCILESLVALIHSFLLIGLI